MLRKSGAITALHRRCISAATGGALPPHMGLGGTPIAPQFHPHHYNEDRKSAFLGHPHTVSIISAPCNSGQPNLGTEHGPRALLDAGLREHITKLDWRVEEEALHFDAPAAADPQPPPGTRAKNCYAVGRASERIAASVAAKAAEESFVLVLGGDHSIGMGTVAGALRARPELGVIWVDAHADINTPFNSLSGNMHGMPIAFVMDPLRAAIAPRMPGCEWLGAEAQPGLAPDRLVYVGLRDVDNAEVEVLREHGVRCFTMTDIDRHGVGRVMEMAIEHAAGPAVDDGEGGLARRRPLHLSFDVDACDPELAPSTGTVVRGGLTFREAHFVAEAVAETGLLVSMDMVEVNPQLGSSECQDRTASLATQIIGSALGNRIM
jgi:arginase